jgi:putative oxidoreductase
MSLPLQSLLSRALSLLARLQWLGPLLVRISLASVFIVTGWGKLHNLPKVTGFFTELGIPMPGFNAGMVSCIEFFGGFLILIGLFTRFAAIPMALSMLVAILTAKLGEVDGVATFFAFNEFTYFACFAWLAVAGAGAVSLDRLLFGRWVKSLPGDVHPPSTQPQGQR